jgi:hypothetical protein
MAVLLVSSIAAHYNGLILPVAVENGFEELKLLAQPDSRVRD